MNNKVDLKTLRIFPYFILALFVSSIISMVALCLILMLGNYAEMSSLLESTSEISMTFNVIEYLIICAIATCLYRMFGINRWFRIAYYSALTYMLGELIYAFAKWLDSLIMTTPMDILATVLRLTPGIGVLLAIFYMLRGMTNIYKKMEKKKLEEETRKQEKLWLIAHLIFLVFSVILLPIIVLAKGPIVQLSIMLFLSVVIYYVTVIIMVYVKTKNFCYDYYMYRYNSGEI